MSLLITRQERADANRTCSAAACSRLGSPSPPAGQSIEGRLIFSDAWFQCNLCPVKLESILGRPADTAHIDPSGRFVFHDVAPGLYTLHAEVDGYEEVNEPIEVDSDGSSGRLITVMMNRKIGIARTEASPVPLVTLSELLETHPKKAVDALKKAMDHKKKDRNDRALKCLEESVRLAPAFYEAHLELGLTYRQFARLDDAEREFQRAHEINRSSVEPLVYLSALYVDANKPDLAVAAGEQAVKTSPGSGPAFAILGVALYKAARLDRAETALKKALGLGSKIAQIHLTLANIYLRQHRNDRVLEQLESYLAENPHGDQRQAVEEIRQTLLNAKRQETIPADDVDTAY